MRHLIAAALLLAARVATAQPSSAPPPHPAEPVRAVRATSPIVIDGLLDEPVWQSDNAVTHLMQVDPHQGDPPTQRTEVRIAFDDEAVYVGARLYDARPDSIVARLSRRDNDSGADLFDVQFDTFGDHRNGYYFGVSVAGTQFDGTLMNDDWSSDAWDGVWSGRAHRDAQGWTAELRIPFSQMRCRGGDRMVWGVNFERVVSRVHEDDKLAFAPRGESGAVSRFPPLLGLDGIRAAHRIEVIPYSTGRAEYLAHAAGDPFHGDSKYTPALGGDLRTNVGSKFTLNATVNPDFGQVEIDPAVVNLSDVETYYDEKRPFFTDGLSVFRCGNNGASDYWNFNWPEPVFFYTRRIGRTPQGAVPDEAAFADRPLATHILGAVKLTGQPAPGWNVGMVHALTRLETADYALGDGERGSLPVEPTTYYGVLRGIRTFNGERQGLGAMTLETARKIDGTPLADAMNRNGLVTAIDGWTVLDAKRIWVLSGYVAGSRIDGSTARIAALEQDPQHYFQRPDRGDLGVDLNATSLSGGIARMWLNRQTGPWMSNSAIGVISPGFDANDLGFSSRDDIVNGHVGLGYMWNKPTPWKTNWWVIGAIAEGWDLGKHHLLNQLFLKSRLSHPSGWSETASMGLMGRATGVRATRGGPAMGVPSGWWGDLYCETDGHAKVYTSLEISPNADAAGSYELSVNPSVTWKPSGRLSLSAGPSLDWNRADAQYVAQASDPLATATYGGRYVFARLNQTTVGATLRLDCAVTPNLTLQLYAQPLVSSGRYVNYRELAVPGSYDFLVYGTRGSTISGADGPGDVIVDPDGTGAAPAIDVGHQDFTFRTLRGDAVLRWEYVPGSTLFVVWTQDRTDLGGDGEFQLRPSLSAIARTPANNIVMVKVSHHFEI